jgi:[acyl-carrier-protein] S-malonyltransferase
LAKIAFIFPGQGAQYVGMGKQLYDHAPAARNVYDACGNAEINAISWEGPLEKLTATVNAQPAIFLADLAAAMALEERGVSPEGAAGFSLGEIPALAYSGMLDMKEAFRLVHKRAEAMHLCTEKYKGGMYAVLGLPDEAVEDLCAQVEGAYPSNYNAPGQVVVSFKAEAAEALKAAVADANGKAVPLAVAGAFHSPLMDEAAAALAHYLESVNFSPTRMPLYANATGKPYSNPRQLLSGQVNSPVLWKDTIRRMISGGYDTFIETGPGKALTGMIKKIDKGVRTFNVHDDRSLEEVVKCLTC